MQVRKLVASCVLGASAMLGTAVQAAVVVGTIPTFGIDYLRFTSTGGAATFNIFGRGFTGGPTGVGVADSWITLAVDNGSPVGALTGTIVGENDDSGAPGWDSDGSTSGFDSFLTLNLVAGDYILGVGACCMTETEFRTGFASTPNRPSDYQLTFDGVTLNGGSVPEPTMLVLVGLALAAAGGASRRRRA